MKQYEFHEAANIFPLFGEKESAELTEDIRQHGLRQDIVLFEGKILDGRNRYLSCIASGVEPRFVQYQGDKSPEGIIAYVWSLGVKRRHLRSDQTAAAAVLAEEFVNARQTEAAASRSEGQRKGGGDRKSPAAREAAKKNRSPQKIGGTDHSREADEQIAKAAGTNRQYITDVRKLVGEDRKLVEQIRDGKLSLSKIKAEKKKQADQAKREEQKRLVAKRAPPEVLKEQIRYACILVDASWRDGLSGPDWIEVVGGMPIGDHAAHDSMIFVRTGGSRIAAGQAETLIAKWGFKLIDEHLLLKGAVDRRGRWFRQTVEEVVVGVRGKPDWPDDRPLGLTQCAPGKVHELIAFLTPFADDLRLELFAQAEHKGWVCWRKDAEPVAA